MSTTPEDGWVKLTRPELYADLQVAGSLAAALEQVAAELRLDVGVVGPGSWGRLLSARIGAAPELHRGALEITSAALTRSFAFSGWSRGAHPTRPWPTVCPSAFLLHARHDGLACRQAESRGPNRFGSRGVAGLGAVGTSHLRVRRQPMHPKMGLRRGRARWRRSCPRLCARRT